MGQLGRRPGRIASVKIVELAELPPRLGRQLADLSWLDGDNTPLDADDLHRMRRLGYRSRSSQSLLAVENGQVLGRVDTSVHSFLTPAGRQAVTWLSEVMTRPDAVRRGIATALLTEAHRRARRRGHRWAFLWTHRPWVAHDLYGRLGYRDAYAPPAALRRIPRIPRAILPTPYRWKKLEPAEIPLLERMLRESSRNRYGFIPRPPGSFQARFRLGWRKTADYRVLLRARRAVGYAYVPSTRYASTAYEVVVSRPEHAPAMLAGLERESAGRWLAFARTTFITDNEPLLRSRGYAVYRVAHPTVMALALRPDSRAPVSADPVRVCRSPRFTFHGGDVI